jgi:hypothetical protein
MKRSKIKRVRTASFRRRRLSAPLGGAVFALAAIGLVSVVVWGVGAVRGIFDNSAQRERYESFIRPVVMTDPVPFTRVENLEQNLILQSSLWAALMSENSSGYSYDENGLLLVPSSDVDVAAVRLFGPKISVTHQSFEDIDASYLFDPEISAYRVPLIAKVAYSPSVEDIDKRGDLIVLRVGYVAPGNIWSTDTQSGKSAQPKPEKYMLYELTRWDEGHYISAVRDVVENAAPVS